MAYLWLMDVKEILDCAIDGCWIMKKQLLLWWKRKLLLEKYSIDHTSLRKRFLRFYFNYFDKRIICVWEIRRDSAICTATTRRRKCRAYLTGKAEQKPEKPNNKIARDSLALYCSYFNKERGERTVVDGYFIEKRYWLTVFCLPQILHGCFRYFLSNHKRSRRF